MPRHPGETGVSLTFFHKIAAGYTTSIAPSIVYSRIVPEKSAAFNAARNGDLVELRKLLHGREAFLSDRDTHGRSMLNVSISHNSAAKRNLMTASKFSMLCMVYNQPFASF